MALAGEMSYRSVIAPLLMLGGVEEAIQSFDDEMARQRGLRAANSLSTIWHHRNTGVLSHPAMLEFYERTGMADYWRRHGNPDFCRVRGAQIECPGP